MQTLIISFKSRNDIFSFSHLIQQHGITNSTVNTPRNIGSPCSLSIRCPTQYLEKIKSLLFKTRPLSFNGLFLITPASFGEQITKLL